MQKVIVIDEILRDAYGTVFNKMELMRYLEAEKILDYLKKYNYIPDPDMVDYAYVIIYSNTHRIDQAIKICKDLISRSMDNKDLEKIVKEVYKQLQNDMKSYTVKDSKAKTQIADAKVDEIEMFLNKVKPSDKRFDDFLDLFALNEKEEDFYIEYFSDSICLEVDKRYEVIEKKMPKQLKTMISKYISKSNSFKKVLDKNSHNISDIGMTLLLNMKDDILFYYYLHKTGMIKKILVNKNIVLPLKNFILYQLYILYINKMITNIKVEYFINNNTGINSTMKELKGFYDEESLDPLNDFVQNVYSDVEFTEMFIESMEIKIDVLNASSFPAFFPDPNRKLEFFVALLYFTSIYEYESQFNDIIGKEYKVSLESVKQEMDILKMMLVMLDNEENYESRN